MRTQGFSKNPGAQQVTSKGSRNGMTGGMTGGKAAPTKSHPLPHPSGGKYSPKAVGSQQLSPGRHSKLSPGEDYAGDGKSYGAGGSKTTRNPASSSAFPKNAAGRGR